jgi:hypothetical protein
MNSLKKIAGINLVVILVYSALIRLANGTTADKASLGIMIMSAFAVGIHVLICLVVAGVGYLNNTKDMGRAWLLSAGIVLVIGFSVCLGNASL